MVVSIVGGGVLALPTALAAFGVRRAVLILVVMGLVNLLSLFALSSAISRSTAPASGRGRLSTLTSEHLGPTAALFATIASICLWFGVLVVFGFGLATSLGDSDGSAAVWAVVILAVIGALVFLQARKLFVASATVVAVLNISILTLMIVVVALRAQTDLFNAGPLTVDGNGTAQTLQLVFGTVLFAYNGHTALFSVAPEVARVDPSGRALRRGATAAMLTAIVMNVGWVVACLSAIPAEQLRAEASTGIDLIVAVGGSWMKPLSVVFVVLAMGVGGLNAAFALGDVISERLPGLRRVSTMLRPGSSVEAFDPLLSVGVTISAVSNGGTTTLIARGRRGRQHHREVIEGDTWDGSALLRELGINRRRAVLRVNVDGRATDGLIVNIESTLPLAEREPPAMRAAVLGAVSDTGHGQLEQLSALIVQSVVRQPAATDDVISAIASRTGAPEELVLEAFGTLRAQRRVEVRDDGLLHAVLGQRSRSSSAYVSALLTEIEDVAEGKNESKAPRRSAALADGVWRRAAQAAPAVIALIVVASLLTSGVSFAAAIDLVAMATIILLGGVIPLLLGISLRARAERPISILRLGDSLPIQVVLVIGFTAVTIVYATVIYDTWYQKLAAVIAFGATATMVIASIRAGGFARRSTLLVELDTEGKTLVSGLDHGAQRDKDTTAVVDVSSRSMSVDMPTGLRPPMLLLALDGEAVPARLGKWTLTVGGSAVSSGQLEDSAGDVIDWPVEIEGPLQCTWELR
jgi:amino acid permease